MKYYVAVEYDAYATRPVPTGRREFYVTDSEVNAAIACFKTHRELDPHTVVGTSSHIVYSGAVFYALQEMQPNEMWVVDTSPAAHLAYLN